MPTTARQILTASYLDIGVLAADATMDAEMGADGLRRLNNMISGWQVQSGTVVCVERQIFPLVENKQTYSIGLGGDFNVPRPSVNIPGAGLLMSGLESAVSITSITRTLSVATVTQTAHGYAVGDQVVIAGAGQLAYNGLQQVESVPTADTWTFTVNGLPVTPATGTLTASALTDQPVELPRPIITLGAWQAQQIKTLPNSLFTTVYYVPSFPFGQIILWPVPDTTTNQLVLYLENVFTGFATLDTSYDWPSLPGYAEALQYQLNKRLAATFQRSLSPALVELARETFGVIKRGNATLQDVRSDAAIVGWRGGYDINTDEIRSF